MSIEAPTLPSLEEIQQDMNNPHGQSQIEGVNIPTGEQSAVAGASELYGQHSGALIQATDEGIAAYKDRAFDEQTQLGYEINRSAFESVADPRVTRTSHFLARVLRRLS